MKQLLYIAIAFTSVSFVSCEAPDDIDGDVTVIKGKQNNTEVPATSGYPDRNDNLPPS